MSVARAPSRVIVIGGGVAGITTAYWLHRAGLEVVVLEREAALADVTSRATGGHIAPGHSGAWASPTSLRTLLRSLYRRRLAYRLDPTLDPRFARWMAAYVRNCTAARYRANTATKIRLAAYAREQLLAIRKATGIEYDGVAGGAVFFYRSVAGFERAARRVALWRAAGQPLERLAPAGIAALDARLAPIAAVAAGALHSPIDEVGDTRLFTQRLAELLVRDGVDIRLSTPVTGLERSGDRVTAALTAGETVAGDAFVFATGGHPGRLARDLGVRLPVYPLRGYTVTVPARGDVVPPIGMVDEEGLVAIARLGDRVRLGGTAEFGRTDRRIEPAGVERLIEIGRGLFPDGADWDRPDPYVCLRPMTPDGPPIVGRSPVENVYLNLGHGHIGWTMSHGAGRIVTDLIVGRPPAIDLAGLTPGR